MLRNILFDAKYFQTYYFANEVDNILSDPESYLRKLDDFRGVYKDGNFIVPYPKFSALHQFIYFVISDLINDASTYVKLDEQRIKEKQYNKFAPELFDFRLLPINNALLEYKIEHPTFEEYLKAKSKDFENANADDVYDYFQDWLLLTGIIDTLVEKMTDETFFILFLNRSCLRNFNKIMARYFIMHIELDFLPANLRRFVKKDGVLKRKRIPKWARNAVCHRDRGRCVLCQRDVYLSLSVESAAQFDHIVPLSQSGMNDVTNLQIMCKKCNQSKGARNNNTSTVYEKWY